MIKTLMYYMTKGLTPTQATKFLNEIYGEQMDTPLQTAEVKEAMEHLATIHR